VLFRSPQNPKTPKPHSVINKGFNQLNIDYSKLFKCKPQVIQSA